MTLGQTTIRNESYIFGKVIFGQCIPTKKKKSGHLIEEFIKAKNAYARHHQKGNYITSS